MKRITAILTVALVGAFAAVSAQESAAPAPAPASAPAQENVKRSRAAELEALEARLDRQYVELKSEGVITATPVYVEAKGRIKSALSIIVPKPASKGSLVAFSSCSTHVEAALLQFQREDNLHKAAKMAATRDSLLSVLHNLHEAIARIEGGRAYKLAQELEVSKAKSSLLQGDLEAKKAELAAERARALKMMQDAQKRFAELQSDLIKVSKDARGTIISMSDILFESGKATLTANLKENLAKIAGILIVYKGPNIVVEGHTDNVGLKGFNQEQSKEYNQKLSEDRAKGVLNYLAEQGVAATRLTAVGYGLDKPIADNATKDGRAKNRRVDLVIQEKSLDDGDGEAAVAEPAHAAPVTPAAPAHAAPAPAPRPAPAAPAPAPAAPAHAAPAPAPAVPAQAAPAPAPRPAQAAPAPAPAAPAQAAPAPAPRPAQAAPAPAPAAPAQAAPAPAPRPAPAPAAPAGK
jgi:outer membrane protein OmpA-like peptidoglycan-associated protein